MRPHAFPRAHRLLRKRDFEQVFREGAYASDEWLAVRVRPNDLPHPRLGLAVGRRSGNAVVRNRIKRRLREAFRIHRESLPGSHDLVVSPKSADIGGRSLEELERSLIAVAARAAERWRRNGPGGRPKREGTPG